jgi:hypothetical protein
MDLHVDQLNRIYKAGDSLEDELISSGFYVMYNEFVSQLFFVIWEERFEG